MENSLESISLSGFKTIKKLVDFKPGPLTILIGPNGAGKSNFISFFQLLAWILQSPGMLQEKVAMAGGASAILHDGPDVTKVIEAEITFQSEIGENQYAFRLGWAGGDTLVYLEEKYRFSYKEGFSSSAPWKSLGVGHLETKLLDKAQKEGDKTASFILKFLQRIVVYQFHNTSATAKMRTRWNINDRVYLNEDGGNIAPFLFRLKEYESQSYQRIVENIRLILPFFADFEFFPDYNNLILSWREKGNNMVYNASQAADGMLRVIALVSLLLQPENNFPEVLILDEPELGLHPFAIKIIAGLIKSASKKTQIIVATQSVSFIDCFDPDDVVVVERKGRESQFTRQNTNSLEEWLEDYSLSELWEKNVIGGRPQ